MGEAMTGAERWAAIEMRLFAAFVAIVDEGSFTAAARSLGYTQSGISQQVASLERIVGRKLLVRRPGGHRAVQLTPAGESLLRYARATLRQLDRAYEELVERDNAAATTVRVATFSSAAVQLLPALARHLRSRSQLRLEIVESTTDEGLYAELEAGGADIGIAALPTPPPFDVETLGSDPYVALVSASSSLARRESIGVPELARHSLIGVHRCPHEAVVEGLLAAGGVDTRQIARYDDNRLIQAQVAAGNAVAVVPRLTLHLGDLSVKALPIDADIPPRVLALVRLRDAQLSPAVQELAELALPVFRRLLRNPLIGLSPAA